MKKKIIRVVIGVGLVVLLVVSGSGGKKVGEMPEDTTVDATDLLYSVHLAAKSKKLEMSTLLETVEDSMEIVETMLGDTATQLRSEISGNAGWSATDDNIYLTSSDDSVGIGTANPTKKLQVEDDILITDTSYLEGPIILGSSKRAEIYYSLGQLYFTDEDGTYTLNDLASSDITGGSGLTLDGTEMDLGGALDQETVISTGNHRFKLTNQYGGEENYFDWVTNSLSIHNNSTLIWTDSAYLINSEALGMKIIDERNDKYGLVYGVDYSDVLKTRDRSVPDVGTVAKIINDSINDFSSNLITGGSGMTLDGTSLDLGGALDQTTTISTGTYQFQLHNNYGGESNYFTFQNSDLTIGVSDIFFLTDSMRLRMDESTGFTATDLRSTKYGIVYAADYSTSLKANDRSIPDVGTVKKVVIDTVETHSFISLNCDTIYVGDSTIVEGDFPLGSGGTPQGNTHAVQVNRNGSFSGVGDSLTFDEYLFIAGDTAATKLWTKSYTSSNYVSNDGGGSDGHIAVWYDADGIRGEGNLRWDDPNYELEIDGRIYFNGILFSSILDAAHTPGFTLKTNYTLSNTDTIVEFRNNAKVLMQMFDDSTAHFGDFNNYGDVKLSKYIPSDTAVIVILPTGLLDTIPIGQVADIGLTQSLPPFEEYQKYWEDSIKLKGVRNTVHIGKKIQDVMIQVEHNYRYDAELREELKITQYEVEKLKITQRLLIAIILLILIARYIRKCTKK